MLKQVLQSGAVVAEDRPTPPVNAGEGGGDGGGSSTENLKSFGSVAELEAADGPFKNRCASEVTGIELIKGKSGQIYLLSDRARIVSKHTLIGGFGTGKPLASQFYQEFLISRISMCFRNVFLILNLRYVPASTQGVEECRKVVMAWPLGDKTMVQIDQQSVNVDQNSFDVMTLYKYLTTIERIKRVTSHSVSYTDITRQTDSAGQDSFKVEVKTPHIYQTMPEPLL